MERRNSGHGESDLQQNRFTAYFEVAATRYKSRYLARWHTVREREPSYDFQEMPQEIGEDPDLLSGLSLMDTFENEACLRALQSLPSRDLEVLLDMVLYDVAPTELGKKLGLSYQGVMSVYHRALKKLRKYLKGGSDK